MQKASSGVLEGSFFSFMSLNLLRSSRSRKGYGSTTLSEFEQRNRRRKRPPLLLRAQGLKVKAFCPFGSVGQRIAQTAEIHHADLVVIGTHGRRGLNRLIFGSYAEEAAVFSKLLLWLSGPRAPLAHTTSWRPARILCPTSFSAGDARICGICSCVSTEISGLLWRLSANQAMGRTLDGLT